MTDSTDLRLGILVGLDELLDTRLGTIARLRQEAALSTLENGYHDRKQDSFQFVDMQQYRDLYTQRDSTTLSLSMCTGVIQLLRELAVTLTEQAIETPRHTGAKIVVNLHPYSENLTVEEKDEILKAVKVWLGGTMTEVILDSISPESLTPELLKAMNVASMFMYHHDEWMEAQTRAFETTRVPEITLFGPALYSITPTEEQLAKEIKEAAHPLVALEMLASPLVHLQLIPVKHFSILSAHK